MIREYFVGLMSGTSLDGVDAVLVEFADKTRLVAHSHLPFPGPLRSEFFALADPAWGDLEKSCLAGNELAQIYAQAVGNLLAASKMEASEISAIGAHGQTIRHRPELGFTVQVGNPSLLAELSKIAVVADFRSRDIAAGGQGAPLVPAFHAEFFTHPQIHRAIVNLGGIANITDLPPNGEVKGFDCGPGCMLLDAWAGENLGLPFDEGGKWAQSGEVLPKLLQKLLDHEFFSLPPPKSTGRELFGFHYLRERLEGGENPADVQATLLAFTARALSGAIESHCAKVEEIYLCGGGAKNPALREAIAKALPGRKLSTTEELGVDPDKVEAFAFAWLARQTWRGEPGNLPAVTGARGKKILGAIYPA